MAERTCSVDDCERSTHARGWCSKHYARWKSHGDPLVVKPRGNARPWTDDEWRSAVRKRVVVDRASGCWLWQGSIDAGGYGRAHRQGTVVRAHRLSYELFVGSIPDGLHLDHLCRVRRCVNPAHLDPVEQAENNRRGVGWAGRHARRSHCKHGHLLAGDNLRIRSSDGSRICRQCNRDRRRAQRQRVKL